MSAVNQQTSIALSRRQRIWNAALQFWDQDPLTLAASVAFYSALSFAPIVAITSWFATLVAPGSEDRVVDELGVLLGPQIRAVATLVVKNSASESFGRGAAGILSIVTLIVSATTAFAQLQYAINKIWSVEPEPVNAVMIWIRQRILSFGMIAVIGFLLIVTLVANALLAALLARSSSVGAVLNEAIVLAVFSLAFAAMFRYVPATSPPLRATLIGGFATAVLFDTGKWMLAAFLASTVSADAYGASGSIVLLLLWVYYSSVVVLIGAALTRGMLPADSSHVAK